MAVAMQNGIVAHASYYQKDYEPNDWIYFKCWQVLKGHRKFLPPQRNESEDEESEDGDTGENMPPLEGTVDPLGDTEAGDTAADGNDTAAAVVPTNTNTSGSDSNTGSDNAASASASSKRKRHSRGGGKGRTASKANAILVEHRGKKLKAMEAKLALEDKRQKSFEAFVNNQATINAFTMAKQAYLMNDGDSDAQEFFKGKINELCGYTEAVPSNDADDEEESDDEH